MRDGSASHTARSVAAHRLEFARVAAPYGDPGADVALARDVAGGLEPGQGRMHDYLRARTAFFDHAVVRSIDRGGTQVVVGAAGYDGRAFRYARPGVRWFEVDHPATQADKLERVARLGIDARHVRFVGADFTRDPVAEPLVAAGLDPRDEALFLLEGVAVYLDREVLERVLGQFRAVTPDGSLLAISVSLTSPQSQARERFRASVAAVGEPVRSVLAPQQALRLLAGRGWQVVEGRDRLRAAGLLLARATDPAIGHPERSRPSAHPQPPAAASPAPVAGFLPLPALLSQALVAFTIECDNEAEHQVPHRTSGHGPRDGASADAPWLTSLAMWANCLRFLPDAGLTVRELRRLARTGTNLDGMRRWGYVTFSPDPGRGKRPGPGALMRPTARGSQARDLWQPIDGIVEARWRDRFGPEAVGALRSALAAVVAGLDPRLPDCLPILGYGLFSRLDPDPGPPAPASPVSLPLWALLSRPLLAFATEFERESSLSLAISANVLRVLTDRGVPSRDIPALAGVSKESVAMAMGIVRKQDLVAQEPETPGSRRTVTRLTAAGSRARQEYQDLAAAVEERWRDRFGADRVSALRASLEPLAVGHPPPLFGGLEPYPDGWRAKVRPPSVLPHYPMVLHRGGYPDGA